MMFRDIKSHMKKQDTTIASLQRGQLQGNPIVWRQGRQVCVKEEYNVEFEIRDRMKMIAY